MSKPKQEVGLTFSEYDFDNWSNKDVTYTEDAFPIFVKFVGMFLRTQRWIDEPFLVQDAVVKLKKEMYHWRIGETSEQRRKALETESIDESRKRAANALVGAVAIGEHG